jgi:hypothetical protein
MLYDKSAIKILGTVGLGGFFYLPIVFGVVLKSVFLDYFWVLLEMLLGSF